MGSKLCLLVELQPHTLQMYLLKWLSHLPDTAGTFQSTPSDKEGDGRNITMRKDE